MDLCHRIPEWEVKKYAEEGPCLDVQRRLSAVHRFLAALKSRDVDLLLPCGKTKSNTAPYCWIASKLLVLNGVLEGVLLELREDIPGVLSLVTLDARSVVDHPDAALTDAAFLVSWLLCHHSCVHTVHLDNSDLFRQLAPTVVARALRRSSGVVDLKLNLRNSVQRTQAVPVLVPALQHMVALESLDLGGLALDRSTVGSVIAVLKSARLRALVLRKLPQVKNVALRLSRALRNCTCLTSLEINDRVRGLPEAALLLEENTTLRRFSLSGVTGELVGEVLLCLARNNTLEELCLSDAALGDYPVQIAPIYAFAANRRLRVLKLRRVELGDAAAGAFATLLRENDTLEEIDFSGSCVSDFGGNELAEALEVNRSLKIVCLQQSQLSEETVEKFARALSKNQHLVRVSLGIVALPEEWRLSDDACDFAMVYERLELTWNTWGLERIASCLSAPLNGEHPLRARGGLLRLYWTRRTTIGGVHAILGAASSVTFLTELTVGSMHSDECGFAEAIAALLVSTSTLKKLEIREAINASHVMRVILRAFEQNSTVCTARFACSLGNLSTISALKRALSVNRSLHSLAFRSLNVHPKSLARLVTGIQSNNVLTDLSFDYVFDDESTQQLRDLLWRNRCLLSRAVKYAQQIAADIESLEAFKALAGRGCLLCALKRATGKTVAECEDIVNQTLDKLQKAV